MAFARTKKINAAGNNDEQLKKKIYANAMTYDTAALLTMQTATAWKAARSAVSTEAKNTNGQDKFKHHLRVSVALALRFF